MPGNKEAQDGQIIKIAQGEILRKAIIRLADQLALNRQELCAITGISEATMSRLYEGKRSFRPDSKEGELAMLLLRLYRDLNTLFGGNRQQCQLWYRAFNYHLRGKPSELVQNIQGLNDVVSYLDAMPGKMRLIVSSNFAS